MSASGRGCVKTLTARTSVNLSKTWRVAAWGFYHAMIPLSPALRLRSKFCVAEKRFHEVASEFSHSLGRKQPLGC